MKTTFSIILFCLAIAYNAQAQKTTVTPFTSGDKYQMKTVINQSTEIMPGMSVTSKIESNNSFKVESITNNKILLSQVLDSLKMNINGMGTDQSFNSQIKEDRDSEMGKAFFENAKTGTVTYLVVDEKTGIASVTDDKGNKIEKETETTGSIGGMGDVKGLENMSLLKFLPQNAQPGTTWSDSSEASGVKTFNVYKLVKLDANTAYVDVNSLMNGQTTIDAQGQQMDVSIDGKGTGNLTIDRKTFLTKKSVINAEINSVADIMGQTMNMKMSSQTTTEIFK